MTKIAEAQRSGDAKTMLATLDEGITVQPAMEPQFGMVKFQVLATMADAQDKALEYGQHLVKSVVKDDPGLLNNVAWLILRPEAKKKPEARFVKLALQAAQRRRTDGEEGADCRRHPCTGLFLEWQLCQGAPNPGAGDQTLRGRRARKGPGHERPPRRIPEGGQEGRLGLRAAREKLARHGFKHVLPFAELLLSKQPHRWVPGRVGPVQQPAPIRNRGRAPAKPEHPGRPPGGRSQCRS